MNNKATFITDYFFGFNGKENDNEVKGGGNQQDYGFRIFDPRLGRFLSVDPLTKDYPWYTPYQFAGNKPIWAIDLDGKEEFLHTRYNDVSGNLMGTKIQIVGAYGMNQNGNGQLDIQTVHYQTATIDGTGNVSKLEYNGTRVGSYSSGTNAFSTPLERNTVTGRDGNGNAISLPIVNSNININVSDPTGVNPPSVAPAVLLSSPILINGEVQKGKSVGPMRAVKSNVYTSKEGSSSSEKTNTKTFYFLNSAGNQQYSPDANRLLPSLGKSSVPDDPRNRNLMNGSDIPEDNRIGSPNVQR